MEENRREEKECMIVVTPHSLDDPFTYTYRESLVAKAMQQLTDYKNKNGKMWSSEVTQKAATMSGIRPNPKKGICSYAQFWQSYGSCAPELRRVAMAALSQVPSISSAERNFKNHKLIQSKVSLNILLAVALCFSP